MEKKLYRNMDNKMLTGVCAGMAEYFNMDPTLMRVIWVVLGLGAVGVLGYLICSFIIPEKPSNYIDAN